MPFSILSIREAISICERQEIAVGIMLLGAGLVFMIMGVRLFKSLIPLSLAAIGFVIGLNTPIPNEIGQWVCGGVAAVVLGIGGSYVTKLSVALLGGGWTGVFAASLAISLGLQQKISMGIGLVFLLAVASLALPLYHQVIAYVTSLQGGMLAVGGLIAILHTFPAFWSGTRNIVVDNSFVVPFFIVSLTVMGFYLQLAETRQLESGMSG